MITNNACRLHPKELKKIRQEIAKECENIIEIQLIRIYEGQIGVDTALGYIIGTIRGEK